MERSEKKVDHGESLAKVLLHYGLIANVSSSKEKIECPFHEDVNPSMLVNFEDGSWYCFGCNESGDSMSFVKKYEKKYNNANDLEACKKFVKIMNDERDKSRSIAIRRRSSEALRPSRQLYDEAYDYYHGLRANDWLRADESDCGGILEYMLARGFSREVLNKAKMKYTFNDNYGIIFPMLDNGKFKGWVCRTTDDEIAKKRKYLYNKGFSRASTLVGNYGSKEYVFVVEGFMDRLKFLQFGEDNVVAILGWKMSDKQIEKLKRKGVKHVISALDNDEYGRKGTAYLRKFFDVTRFCYLKGCKDPGDMNEVSFKKMMNATMRKYKLNA